MVGGDSGAAGGDRGAAGGERGVFSHHATLLDSYSGYPAPLDGQVSNLL